MPIWWWWCEPWLPLMRSTHTPLHCGGRNPSSLSSPCLLSGGWHSVRRLCCLPWSFCAQNLGGEEGKSVGGGEKKSMSEISIPLSEESMREAENFSAVRSYFWFLILHRDALIFKVRDMNQTFNSARNLSGNLREVFSTCRKLKNVGNADANKCSHKPSSL